MDDFDKKCLMLFREQRKDLSDIPDKHILNLFDFAQFKLNVSCNELKKAFKDTWNLMSGIEKILIVSFPFVSYVLYVLL